MTDRIDEVIQTAKALVAAHNEATGDEVDFHTLLPAQQANWIAMAMKEMDSPAPGFQKALRIADELTGIAVNAFQHHRRDIRGANHLAEIMRPRASASDRPGDVPGLAGDTIFVNLKDLPYRVRVTFEIQDTL